MGITDTVTACDNVFRRGKIRMWYNRKKRHKEIEEMEDKAEEKIEEKIGIRYMDIEEVARWERNPKRHDIGSIVASIRRYGFRDAPIYDEVMGCIIAGNGRSIALRGMKEGGEEAPRGVVVKGGEWLMPVQIGVDAVDRVEGEAFGLDHNNIGLLGGDFTIKDIAKIWDDGFIEIGKELVMSGVGAISFDGDDIDYLEKAMEREKVEEEEEEEEDISNYEDRYGVEEGQEWRVGEHVVICRDSSEMIQEAEICIIDPTYWKAHDELWRGSGRKMTNRKEVDLGWLKIIENNDFSAVYCFVADGQILEIMERFRGYELINSIMWNRGVSGIGSGDYVNNHETCLYYTRGERKWNGDKTQSSVWEIKGKKESGILSEQKPIELMMIPIKNSTIEGDIVYDPLCGTGTTLIASARLGRKCIAVDIEPLYVSMAMYRLSQEIGEEPRLWKPTR